MSGVDLRPAATVRGGRAHVTTRPVRQLLTGKDVPWGESTVVRRLLPSLGRRMVGAWCFVDHYGPDDIADETSRFGEVEGCDGTPLPAPPLPAGPLKPRGRER